jgi:hypothetical protein
MGMGGPEMGGGQPGGQQQPPMEFKAQNVWDVLERILTGKHIGVHKIKMPPTPPPQPQQQAGMDAGNMLNSPQQSPTNSQPSPTNTSNQPPAIGQMPQM